MEHNKALAMTALTLALSAGAANAHEIPAITAGDPFTVTEGVINWTATGGKSLNNSLVDQNVLAYHFDVTTAGLLDVYTSDHDDANSYGGLAIFQKDTGGADWSLVGFNYEGARSATDPNDYTTPTNLFNVKITGWVNSSTPGKSDAGLRMNFDTGSYLALVIGSQGWPVGHDPVGGNPDPASMVGAKLSNGFTWSYLGDPCVDSGLCSGVAGLSDFYIKASPGSLAVAGPTVELPPSNVPVPGAVWLMGTVLAGFTAFGRKKAAVAA